MMAAVGRSNTGPELALRRALHRRGLRYRLHRKDLPGSPDIVFPGRRCVVFVHGCFWHAHSCRFGTRPSSRREFWDAKFAANRARDQRVVAALLADGWRVLTVWECALKTPEGIEHAAQLTREWLRGEEPDFQIP
jgi:DNA mismatch endonuclease (patch repair protein)